jgi:hypothetical protein
MPVASVPTLNLSPLLFGLDMAGSPDRLIDGKGDRFIIYNRIQAIARRCELVAPAFGLIDKRIEEGSYALQRVWMSTDVEDFGA